MKAMLQFLRDDLQAMRRYFRDARGVRPKLCVNLPRGVE